MRKNEYKDLVEFSNTIRGVEKDSGNWEKNDRIFVKEEKKRRPEKISQNEKRRI